MPLHETARRVAKKSLDSIWSDTSACRVIYGLMLRSPTENV